jgi:hypothetical protein
MLSVSLDCPFWLPLCLVYPMLSVSLDCPFWLPLRLVYPMLSVSLDCPLLIAPSSCVPYVVGFSRLSTFDCAFVLCTLCCQFLWIVHFDCSFVLWAIKSGQSRETDNIGYTRRRGNQKWTIQRNWQHRVHKTKGQSKVDNPEKLTT